MTEPVLYLPEPESGADEVAVACHCPCHAVIQPGLIPCPTCDTSPDHSSR